MATGQPTEIGSYIVLSKRTRGGYRGVVGDATGYAVYCSQVFSGRGAKDRGFQDARMWAESQSRAGSLKEEP